jgi:hypothetical protein
LNAAPIDGQQAGTVQHGTNGMQQQDGHQHATQPST